MPRILTAVDTRTIEKGTIYNTSEEFKEGNFITYSIAKDRKLMPYIFPNEEPVRQVFVPAKANQEFMSSTPAKSLDNLMDKYSSMKYRKGEHRKVLLTVILRDINLVLKQLKESE